MPIRKITEQKKAILGLRLNSWKEKNPTKFYRIDFAH